MSNEIQPFRMAATDAQLDDLKHRLSHTRWPERECVDDWTQGLPLAYAQEVARYWLEKYDWRAREKLLNRFPQFKTTVDGVGIHFVHVRSPHANALPLVMTYEEYRNVADVKWPSRIRVTASGQDTLFAADEVKLNEPVDDSVFEIPPEIRDLAQKKAEAESAMP